MFLEHQISITRISEGSCDTEDCFAITGINYNLKYIQIELQLFQIVILFHNITVFLIN